MIYSFSQLSEDQKRKIYQFITSFPYKGIYESCEEMTKLYSGIVFDNGNGYFSLWTEDTPIATMGVISKDAEVRGEIFLVSVNIKEEKKHELSKLLEKAYDYCSGSKNVKYKLGVMYDRYYLIDELEKNGFIEAYRNLEMVYTGGSIRLEEALDKKFKSLCPENVKDYQKVENAAFLQAPNGGQLEDSELQSLLDEYSGNNLCGVYYENDIPAGTYTLELKNDAGWISSIGVAPDFQRRGIGRKLLHKSIGVLQAAGAVKVMLSVFNTNTRAFELYKKEGFEVEREQSIWFTLP